MPSWFQPVATGFLVSAGLVTVAVLGWAVWWVPWHRRTGWRAIVQQGAAVLVSVVCSVAMIGLMLNRSNDWYPTWRSVLGVRERRHGTDLRWTGPDGARGRQRLGERVGLVAAG